MGTPGFLLFPLQQGGHGSKPVGRGFNYGFTLASWALSISFSALAKSGMEATQETLK